MPSPIGHALAGLAIAWTADHRRRAWSGLALAGATLAALADIDLAAPYQHRAYTHSAGAVILVTIIAAVVTRWVTPGESRRITLVCAAAYASHILLDWLAFDDSFPYGIRALWPFSDAWLISGWNVFAGTARRHLFARPTLIHNLHAIGREIEVLGPIVAAIYLARFFGRPRQSPPSA
jgi:hypothetical protein